MPVDPDYLLTFRSEGVSMTSLAVMSSHSQRLSSIEAEERYCLRDTEARRHYKIRAKTMLTLTRSSFLSY